MKNGFASVSAFNKAFKDKYDCTPSKYQNSHKDSLSASTKHTKNNFLHKKKLHSYLKDTPISLDKNVNNDKIDITISNSYNNITPWNKKINQMINIGTASDLLKMTFRNHIISLKNNLISILHEWKKTEYLPDFISINCYPYIIEKNGNIYFSKKSTDMFFVNHNIEIIRGLMAKSNFNKVELHVSEFSLTLSNRNKVNDSLQKAAFLLQSLISNTNKADMIGYWLGTDVYADYNDTTDHLFGGCGLLTKTNLPKPSAYAYKFINQQYDTILKQDKNYIVTSNRQNSWKMACHNFKNFSYNYYIMDEQKISYNDIQYMIEDDNKLTLKFHFDKIKNGTYLIKHQIINNKNGNIQKEFYALPLDLNITNEEYDYLEKVSRPKLSVQEYSVVDSKLTFDVILNANDLHYFYITYKY